MSTPGDPVLDAYRVCERITWEQARNFAYGIRLLPPGKRRVLSAVYAFARRIDDIGDGDLASPDKLRLLREIADGLDAPPGDDDPVRLALADAAAHGLPLAPFRDLVDGCRDDVVGRSYATADELHEYCRKVAGSIGRLSLSVFGTTDPDDATPLADALGVALQLTNILRDVAEDARLGRVYLPGEDLRRFGCPLEPGAADAVVRHRDRLVPLIRFEAGLARHWYALGLQLLPLLDRRSRACCAALAGIYLRLLECIEADPARVLAERVSLPARTKVGVAVHALALGTP